MKQTELEEAYTKLEADSDMIWNDFDSFEAAWHYQQKFIDEHKRQISYHRQEIASLKQDASDDNFDSDDIIERG